MSHVLQIQTIAEEQRAKAYQAQAGKESLAVIVEGYQRYMEYLDELEIVPLGKFSKNVTVTIDGQQVKFKNDEDFANWLAENMT